MVPKYSNKINSDNSHLHIIKIETAITKSRFSFELLRFPSKRRRMKTTKREFYVLLLSVMLSGTAD